MVDFAKLLERRLQPKPPRPPPSGFLWIAGPRDLVLDGWRFAAFLDVIRRLGATTIAHGAARGMDTMADVAADALRLPKVVRAADWNTHGKRAGHLRNEELAELTARHGGMALLATAEPSGDIRTPGTSDALMRAIRRDLRVDVLVVPKYLDEIIHKPDVYGI